jgi:transposase-like protein
VPPVCSLCRHAEKQAIDAALVEGRDSLRNIAERFGTSAPTLLRHREHVHGSLVLAREAEEVTRADGLLEILREAVKDARRLRDKAEKDGDYRCAVAAVKTLCDTVERLAAVGERLAQVDASRPPEPKPVLTDGELVGAIEALLARGAASQEVPCV